MGQNMSVNKQHTPTNTTANSVSMDEPWENPREATTHMYYQYGQSESNDTQIHQQIIAKE